MNFEAVREAFSVLPNVDYVQPNFVYHLLPVSLGVELTPSGSGAIPPNHDTLPLPPPQANSFDHISRSHNNILPLDDSSDSDL